MLLIPILAAACDSLPAIEEGYVHNGLQSLYYKTMGSGDPMVVLHGGPGFDHRQFLPFIWELAQSHKVILYDQRGTGLSSGPIDSASVNIDAFIEDIEAIRNAFGIEKMNLLGHSWGGILAMYYSLRHEDKLKSLILCSTAATVESFPEMRATYEENRAPGDAQLLEGIYESDAFRSGDPVTVEQFWRVYFKPYFADQTLVEELDLRFTENTIKNSNAVASYVLQSIGDFDLHEDLKGLQTPTLILHGDADPMHYKYAERIHESIVGSELVIVKGAGHWLFVDGTDVFSRSILEFLTGLASPARQESPRVSFLDSGQNLGNSRAFGMVSGDLDGDDDLDLLVLGFLGSTRVWINDGTGRFTDTGQSLGGEGAHGAEFGDLDGDGVLDVFLVQNGSTDRILLNDGRGTLIDSAQRLGGEEEWGTEVTLGDLDGDGDLDAFVTVYHSPARQWLNDGTGHFTDSGFSLGMNLVRVAVDDLDADGDLDAFATYSGDVDRVWMNDGAGVLVDSGQRLGPVEGWGHVELGDLDGDGDLDAVVTDSELGIGVWLNDGTGAFSLPSDYFGVGARAALGDLNGDGTLDIVATAQDRICRYWLNDGHGGFTGDGTMIGEPGGLSISLGDVDGDSDLDALVGKLEDTGGNRIYLNQRLAAGG